MLPINQNRLAQLAQPFRQMIDKGGVLELHHIVKKRVEARPDKGNIASTMPEMNNSNKINDLAQEYCMFVQ
jgi:hypothetical protein